CGEDRRPALAGWPRGPCVRSGADVLGRYAAAPGAGRRPPAGSAGAPLRRANRKPRPGGPGALPRPRYHATAGRPHARARVTPAGRRGPTDRTGPPSPPPGPPPFPRVGAAGGRGPPPVG